MLACPCSGLSILYLLYSVYFTVTVQLGPNSPKALTNAAAPASPRQGTRSLHSFLQVQQPVSRAPVGKHGILLGLRRQVQA